jgi:hypothetical protein
MPPQIPVAIELEENPALGQRPSARWLDENVRQAAAQ